jgi:hypothetical protein
MHPGWTNITHTCKSDIIHSAHYSYNQPHWCLYSFAFEIPQGWRLSAETCRVLTFIGPCIVIYFHSKTNQMHNISNLFYFGTTLYMFWTVSPSIIRSLRLYIQHHIYIIQILWLLASGNEMELQFHLVPASKQPQILYDIYLMVHVQSWTPDDGRRDRLKHVECCSKIK